MGGSSPQNLVCSSLVLLGWSNWGARRTLFKLWAERCRIGSLPQIFFCFRFRFLFWGCSNEMKRGTFQECPLSCGSQPPGSRHGHAVQGMG